MKFILTIFLVVSITVLGMSQDNKEAGKRFEQFQNSYVGLGLAFNEYSEELGLQIRAKSDFKNSRFSSAIYVNLYGEQSIQARGINGMGNTVNLRAEYRAIEFMVDVHYNIVHKSFKFYPLIGVGVLYETLDAEAEDDDDLLIVNDSETSLAFNFGLGLQYELFYFLTVFAEPNVTIYTGDDFFGEGWGAFQAGVMYSF